MSRSTSQGTGHARRPLSRAARYRFVVSYFCWMGLFLVAVGYRPLARLVDLDGLYTGLVVRASAALLSFFVGVFGVEGSVIHLPGLSMDVRFGCNGLEAVFIYGAGLLSYPATWRERVSGLLAGMAAIQFLNVLRIASLGVIGVRYPSFFPVFHIYVAQGMMIVVALVLFVWWIGRVEGKGG